jgi:hypothetical protein
MLLPRTEDSKLLSCSKRSYGICRCRIPLRDVKTPDFHAVCASNESFGRGSMVTGYREACLRQSWCLKKSSSSLDVLPPYPIDLSILPRRPGRERHVFQQRQNKLSLKTNRMELRQLHGRLIGSATFLAVNNTWKGGTLLMFLQGNSGSSGRLQSLC